MLQYKHTNVYKVYPGLFVYEKREVRKTLCYAFKLHCDVTFYVLKMMRVALYLKVLCLR